jgi:hypothetical protein
MSDCCIKETKGKKWGPLGGSWKGPYLDPKWALGVPQWDPQGAPSGPLEASIGALSRTNFKP